MNEHELRDKIDSLTLERDEALARVRLWEKPIEVEIVRGVEGLCLVIGGLRVAGPKSWGGGEIVHSWKVPVERIYEAVIHGIVDDVAAEM